MASQTPQSARPNRRRKPGGKWVAIGFIALWVVLLVAVYVVIVQLEIGGEKAIRLPEEDQPAAEQEQAPAEKPAGESGKNAS